MGLEGPVTSTPVWWVWLTCAAIALAVLVAVGLYLRLRRRVLLRMVELVRGLVAGDLSTDLATQGTDEFASLSSSLEALRHRLLAQLELIDRQRGMLQALVDHLQEGVIVARPDGRIALINPTAMRMLDLNPDVTPVGRPVEACILHHPLQRLLGGLGAGGDHGKAADETRLELVTARGTTHVLARASEVLLAEPEMPVEDTVVGRVVMLTDITNLQRVIQVRTDFAANASHELRTPLSTIRAAVETLLGMDLSKEALPARVFLDKIDRQSSRLESLVEDLLDLSRLETPAEQFKPETIDCRRLMQDLQLRFAERVEQRRLQWNADWQPVEARTIVANPHLLRLAVDNLVDNAIKFTEPGGHVDVRLRVTPAEAVIEVCDDGCGIPEEDQQRVFERFYQVQRARSGPERGTGLGLAIVRHSVAAMRGNVHLESRPGEGTRVRVVIPQGTG